jgi:hypothetical protein
MFYEKLVSTFESARRRILEEQHRHLHRRENLTSHTETLVGINCPLQLLCPVRSRIKRGLQVS